MLDNKSDQLCEYCNSHIAVFETNKKIYFECSYCGEEPEDIQDARVVEEDD